MNETALDRLAWPALAGSRRLLAVPVGSTEQHGPHLPLGTDTRVAVALATELARHRPEVVVAPALAFGASGEHQGFPGTLSIGREALELVVVELVRSACHTFAGTVLVSTHGGNAVPLARAVRRLGGEGHRVLCWHPPAGVDAHAGRTETSLLLALAPGEVDMARAAAGATAPIGQLMDALVRDGVRAVSTNGVLGDPTRASAAEGRRLLARMASELSTAVAQWAG